MFGRSVGWRRQRVEANLNDTASLIRTTLVDDGAGGFTRVETTLGPYPCRFRPLQPMAGAASGTNQTLADRIATLEAGVFVFSYSLDLLPTDVVEHTSGRWEVIGDNDPYTDAPDTGVLVRRAE